MPTINVIRYSKAKIRAFKYPGSDPKLRYFDIFTGIYAEQTAINYPLIETNNMLKINVF